MKVLSCPLLRLLALVVGLAAWSGAAFAECTEGSLDYKTDTHEFKYCDDSETWQSLGGGDALGDRIVSGTLAVTANSATSYVSLSTAGTTWGYLSSGASYLPTISAGKVSPTAISTTYVQIASASTVLSCNTAATGTMRYTSGTMQVCDGSSWGNIGIGVPTGTIAAFEASSCPAGWSEYTPARGRFLRGIDNGAGRDPDGTRSPGNAQNDAFQGHHHNFKFNAGTRTTGSFDTYSISGSGKDDAVVDPISDGSNGTPRTANETRPKNVAVTFCQYAGFDSELSAGVATLASLSDVSVGGAAAGQALVFDGATWVPSTTSVPAPTESFIIAASDEATAIEAGEGKSTFRMPYGFTVTAVRCNLNAGQTGGSLFTVDINESGSSILSTKLTFDNNESTTTTAATPAVISDASLADDAEISIDVDQVGDGDPAGLKCAVIGNQ